MTMYNKNIQETPTANNCHKPIAYFLKNTRLWSAPVSVNCKPSLIWQHCMTTAGHVTHQPIAALESGSVNLPLGLTELDATGS